MERTPLAGTRYALLSPLGEGAMGEVFLGEHEELGKRVVIKLLRPQLATRADLVERLRREARLLAQIRHPSLVDIYDLSVTGDGRPFFVMEYVEGANLRDYLGSVGGTLEVPIACELLSQALDALDAAHGRGVIHRDIKPENLLIARDGRLKVLDFGVAKLLERADVTSGANTAAGLIIGTPRYMSPEQAKGEAIGPSSDLYAIGCVLFELVTGMSPFQGRTPQEMLRAHVTEQPPTMSARVKSFFDPELEDVVGSLLAKDPMRRPGSAAITALQLRRIAARLSGRTTSMSEEKPTVQVDLDPSKIIASAHAVDAISTTAGVVTPKIDLTPPPEALPSSPITQGSANVHDSPTLSSPVSEPAPKTPRTERLQAVAANEPPRADVEPTVPVANLMAIAPTVKVDVIPTSESRASIASPIEKSSLATTSPALRRQPSSGSPIRPVVIGVGVVAILAAGSLAAVLVFKGPSASKNSNGESPTTEATQPNGKSGPSENEGMPDPGKASDTSDEPSGEQPTAPTSNDAPASSPSQASTKGKSPSNALSPKVSTSASGSKSANGKGGKPPALDDRD